MYIHLLRLKSIYEISRDFQLSVLVIGLFHNYLDNWLSTNPLQSENSLLHLYMDNAEYVEIG